MERTCSIQPTVIQSFKDGATEDVYNGQSTAAARRALPTYLLQIARRRLEQLDKVERLSDLNIPPGNRLEALKGDRAGQHSIRINNRYRICFRWTPRGPERVEIVDYH